MCFLKHRFLLYLQFLYFTDRRCSFSGHPQGLLRSKKDQWTWQSLAAGKMDLWLHYHIQDWRSGKPMPLVRTCFIRILGVCLGLFFFFWSIAGFCLGSRRESSVLLNYHSWNHTSHLIFVLRNFSFWNVFPRRSLNLTQVNIVDFSLHSLPPSFLSMTWVKT